MHARAGASSSSVANPIPWTDAPAEHVPCRTAPASRAGPRAQMRVHCRTRVFASTHAAFPFDSRPGQVRGGGHSSVTAPPPASYGRHAGWGPWVAHNDPHTGTWSGRGRCRSRCNTMHTCWNSPESTATLILALVSLRYSTPHRTTPGYTTPRRTSPSLPYSLFHSRRTAGRTYFWNQVTRESRWETPVMPPSGTEGVPPPPVPVPMQHQTDTRSVSAMAGRSNRSGKDSEGGGSEPAAPTTGRATRGSAKPASAPADGTAAAKPPAPTEKPTGKEKGSGKEKEKEKAADNAKAKATAGKVSEDGADGESDKAAADPAVRPKRKKAPNSKVVNVNPNANPTRSQPRRRP